MLSDIDQRKKVQCYLQIMRLPQVTESEVHVHLYSKKSYETDNFSWFSTYFRVKSSRRNSLRICKKNLIELVRCLCFFQIFLSIKAAVRYNMRCFNHFIKTSLQKKYACADHWPNFVVIFWLLSINWYFFEKISCPKDAPFFFFRKIIHMNAERAPEG